MIKKKMKEIQLIAVQYLHSWLLKHHKILSREQEEMEIVKKL